MAHLWAKWVRYPCRLGDPHRFTAGGKIRSGPIVGKGLRQPCDLGDAHRCTAGGRIRSGPLLGNVATSPLPCRGCPPAAERGEKSEVAHLWAKWLRHPCRLGDPHRCTAGGKIRSGPLVGKVATSPLPSRGSAPLQSRGQNQKWPTSGQGGFVTPAVSEIPSASERGANSEVAHLWAKWLRHHCRLRDPHRFRAGGENQKWSTYRQSGYTTPAVSGNPTASQRRAKSQMAHLWANWLRQSGRFVGKVAPSPLPSRGSPALQSRGENQKRPTYGQTGYVTPALSGIPTASHRGAKCEVAHKWAKWLRHPCRLGDPHRFRAGGKMRSCPQVGKVATSPLPSRGSPAL